jgi:hypothetical protein
MATATNFGRRIGSKHRRAESALHTSSNREVGEFGWIQKLGRWMLQAFLGKITTPLKSIIYVRKYQCSCEVLSWTIRTVSSSTAEICRRCVARNVFFRDLWDVCCRCGDLCPNQLSWPVLLRLSVPVPRILPLPRRNISRPILSLRAMALLLADLAGAESEKTIPTGLSFYQKSGAIEELKRILHLHLQESEKPLSCF